MEHNQELRNKPMHSRSTNISQGSQEYLVGRLFNKWYWVKLVVHMRIKFDLPYSTHKIHVKWIKDFNLET